MRTPLGPGGAAARCDWASVRPGPPGAAGMIQTHRGNDSPGLVLGAKDVQKRAVLAGGEGAAGSGGSREAGRLPGTRVQRLGGAAPVPRGLGSDHPSCFRYRSSRAVTEQTEQLCAQRQLTCRPGWRRKKVGCGTNEGGTLCGCSAFPDMLSCCEGSTACYLES